MGAYSPVPSLPEGLLDVVLDRFIEPTLAELRRRGIDYRGTLYAGLMLTPEGPKLVEYNVRFGDPEAQVVLPLVASDLFDLLAAAADGELARHALELDAGARVCVVAASPGYPEAPETGSPIKGLDAVAGADVFCAGVAETDDGSLVTAGGRVLNVVGAGATIAAARAAAYDGLGHISFAGMHYRTDIAAAAAEEDSVT
jgi:phosphoribosylamine--glycine ligase